MKINEKIKAGIRHLAKTEHPVLSGVVQSVDTDANTAVVTLTLDDAGSPTQGILLNVILNNTNGLLMVPGANANCIVGNVDGSAVRQLLWAEKYDSVKLTIENTVITADANQVDLKQGNLELNMSNNLFSFKNNSKNLFDILKNTLTHILALTVTTNAGPSGTPINMADFQQALSDLSELLN